MELGDITQHKLRLPFAHIPLKTSFTITLLVRQNATHKTEKESLHTIKKTGYLTLKQKKEEDTRRISPAEIYSDTLFIKQQYFFLTGNYVIRSDR
jgi:hypothetical protein